MPAPYPHGAASGCNNSCGQDCTRTNPTTTADSRCVDRSNFTQPEGRGCRRQRRRESRGCRWISRWCKEEGGAIEAPWWPPFGSDATRKIAPSPAWLEGSLARRHIWRGEGSQPQGASAARWDGHRGSRGGAPLPGTAQPDGLAVPPPYVEGRTACWIDEDENKVMYILDSSPLDPLSTLIIRTP
jgi:hypothetical protein